MFSKYQDTPPGWLSVRAAVASSHLHLYNYTTFSLAWPTGPHIRLQKIIVNLDMALLVIWSLFVQSFNIMTVTRTFLTIPQQVRPVHF